MQLKKLIYAPKKIIRALQYAFSESERPINSGYSKEAFAHLGEGSIIEKKVYISYPKRVHIGRNSLIQGRTILHSMGGILIGDYTGIGYGTTILSFVHNYNSLNLIPYDNTIHLKPVAIRDFVWIGWYCKINPGVEIGEGAILGMGAVVAKDVPPHAIVMGNPAEVVGYRNKENFEKCKKEGLLNNHRIDHFIEKIPLMMKRKYEKDLQKVGMI